MVAGTIVISTGLTFPLILLFLAKKYFGVSIGGLMDEEFIGEPWSWPKLRSVIEHLVVPVIVIDGALPPGPAPTTCD